MLIAAQYADAAERCCRRLGRSIRLRRSDSPPREDPARASLMTILASMHRGSRAAAAADRGRSHRAQWQCATRRADHQSNGVAANTAAPHGQAARRSPTPVGARACPGSRRAAGSTRRRGFACDRASRVEAAQPHARPTARASRASSPRRSTGATVREGRSVHPGARAHSGTSRNDRRIVTRWRRHQATGVGRRQDRAPDCRGAAAYCVRSVSA